MTRVLVTGGNGALGREVVPKLIEAGYTARIMSRRPRPARLLPGTEWAQADLETGQGIFEAVSGSDVIVHAASSVTRHTRHDDLPRTLTKGDKGSTLVKDEEHVFQESLTPDGTGNTYNQALPRPGQAGGGRSQ